MEVIKNKTRVLFILHLPPPVHGAAMVGQYIHDSEIIRSEYECQYINLAMAQSLEDIGKVGIKKIVLLWNLLRNIKKTIKGFKPGLVYLTPNAQGGAFYKDFIIVSLIKFWCCPLKKYGKPQIILHFHNKGCKDFSNNKYNDWMYRRFFDSVSVILLSDLLYDDVAEYVSKSNCFICGNGIPSLPTNVEETIIYNKQRKTEFPVVAPLNILYLSNMMAEKGVWTLLDACLVLKQKGIDFRCMYVGGWKDVTEEAFIRKVAEYGLKKEVAAVGAKYEIEKEQYWLSADVFVFPTYYHNECFPLVLLEAMQYALPCVSTNEAAIPDIIDDGEMGFVVEKRNPRQLAEKLILLANDRNMCIEMGKRGCQKFKSKYTLKSFERNICGIFEQVINNEVG